MNDTVHEDDAGDMQCTEQDPANYVPNFDAGTQCEPRVLLDAETQSDKILKRSIGIQTLAPRKKKTRKSQRLHTSLSPNVNCPVGTLSTPMEIKQHKPSAARALYNNGPDSALTVMKETDTNAKYNSEPEETDGLADNTSDSEFTSNTDSDEDYLCSESESTTDESDEEELKNESKFVVFESMLDQLFINCKTCGSLCEIEKSVTGSMVSVKATCCKNHTFHWRSQPQLNNKPAGNILIPAAIVFSGGSYEPLKQFSNALNLKFVNKDQFYDVQDKIIFPVINNAYKKQQKDIIETLKDEKTAVNLCGDGRSDSPGHNAKYGTYSLMDEATGNIVDFSLVQVSEVTSSNAMENEGCQRSLNKVLSQDVNIRSLATDRHTTITAERRKKFPSIIHQYDVWHLSKWVTKKLSKKAKKKGNKPLFKWIKCVSNHLWWCSQTCGGNAEALRERWVSILNHVVNKHKWKNNKHFKKCEHGPMSKRKERKTKWLDVTSSAYVALEEVVLNKKFLKDIGKLTEFHHTGELEVYHSLLLKYIPKRLHFSYKGMVARTQLAVLDHNTNTGREQAKITKGDNKGQKKYKLVFPKGQKKWVAKPIKTGKSFSFVEDLMEAVVSIKNDTDEKDTSDSDDEDTTWAPCIPNNIAPIPRPSREEVIAAHRTRMLKKQ